jgi:hypothetical protein
MGERKPQAVNAMRSYLMHSRFWMGNSKNNINGAMRWLAYRTLAMRVQHFEVESFYGATLVACSLNC